MNSVGLLVGDGVNVGLSIGGGANADLSADGGNKASLSVAADSSANLEIDKGASADLKVGAEFIPVGVPAYHGEYEITPTRETQVFGTTGKRLEHDFTVMPIPKNYGLITWNGAALTVS